MPQARSIKNKDAPTKIGENPQVRELQEEIIQVRKHELKLRNKTQTIETELKKMVAERDLFKKKFVMIKQQLDNINASPHLVAKIESILSRSTNPKAIIRISSGQTFICPFPPMLNIDPGDSVSVHQRSMSIMEKIPAITESEIYNFITQDNSEVFFTDIGGLKPQLFKIRELVELSFKQQSLFDHFHIDIPKGILLYGHPGTGKTLIAKAIAQGIDAVFYNIPGPELVKKYIGEGARLIREIFNHARNQPKPAIIFIDEIDAIAGARENENRTGEREINRTLMQLLIEMDGFNSNSQIRIIAATNRIDILDPAILRPGRFDRIIELPLPDLLGRKEILHIHLSNIPTQKIDVLEIAKITEGFSGADLKALCTEASLVALRSHINGNRRRKVLPTDFIEALNDFPEYIGRKNKREMEIDLKVNDKIYA